MSYIDLVNLFPNIYKLTKVWEYEYDKILFFGFGNASGTLRFSIHQDPNDTVLLLSR